MRRAAGCMRKTPASCNSSSKARICSWSYSQGCIPPSSLPPPCLPYAEECCNWIRPERILHVRVQWRTSDTAPRASLVSTSPQFPQCCSHSTSAADVAVIGYRCCTRRRCHQGCTACPIAVLAAQRKCRGRLSTVRGGK